MRLTIRYTDTSPLETPAGRLAPPGPLRTFVPLVPAGSLLANTCLRPTPPLTVFLPAAFTVVLFLDTTWVRVAFNDAPEDVAKVGVACLPITTVFPVSGWLSRLGLSREEVTGIICGLGRRKPRHIRSSRMSFLPRLLRLEPDPELPELLPGLAPASAPAFPFSPAGFATAAVWGTVDDGATSSS